MNFVYEGGATIEMVIDDPASVETVLDLKELVAAYVDTIGLGLEGTDASAVHLFGPDDVEWEDDTLLSDIEFDPTSETFDVTVD